MRMQKAIAMLICCSVLTLDALSCFGQGPEAGKDKEYGAPTRFEKAIKAFETQDRENPPAQGAIVCIGSSSMRGWHEKIAEDLAPLTVIPRGFGGSNMNDALYYANRIVFPYKPRAVVVYEGDNDIAQEISLNKFLDAFRAFVKTTHRELPQCRLYFLSIKPSVKRWHLWQTMQEANRLVAAECAKDERLTYLDIGSGMLDDAGNPRKEIFKEDNLHMNRDGYIIWRDKIRPILLKAELQFEPKKDAKTSEDL